MHMIVPQSSIPLSVDSLEPPSYNVSGVLGFAAGEDMIDPEQMSNAFGLNLNIIRMQTENLTHEDSLLQPPFRSNCLNWVLGHIATNRNRVLTALGEEPVLSEEEAARYEAGSDPIKGEEEGILTLVMLLAALEHAQENIATALGRITIEELASEI